MTQIKISVHVTNAAMTLISISVDVTNAVLTQSKRQYTLFQAIKPISIVSDGFNNPHQVTSM
jgi:hypothetical protein